MDKGFDNINSSSSYDQNEYSESKNNSSSSSSNGYDGSRQYGGFRNRNYGGYRDQNNYGQSGYRQNNYSQGYNRDQNGYNGYRDQNNYGGYGDQDRYRDQDYREQGSRQNYRNQAGYNNYRQNNYQNSSYRPRSGYNQGGGYGQGGYREQNGYGSYNGNYGNYRSQEYSGAPTYGNRGFVKRSKNQALAPRRPKSTECSIDVKTDEFYEHTGVLELHPNGYGFLRSAKSNYDRVTSDPFVAGNVILKLGLKPGVKITGSVQPARGNQGPRVREIYEIDGMTPEEFEKFKKENYKPFDELTPVTPKERLKLETINGPISTRVIDILAPLGKGQRALIVAPPRSGKTVLLQQICQAVTMNYPSVHCIVLLIDERPEEVTDFQQKVNAEVVASSLDRELESHIRLAQFVIERCKRLVEMGQHVFLLLDSITRLARSFNKWVGNTGRTMSGGVDIRAMDVPKRIFSSARATEGGGSLTIVGTALIETGSRMDELIFQEFKGTGNMELVLDRRLADRRVWPAIDIAQSGTRHEDLLLSAEDQKATTMIRRALSSMDPILAMEKLTEQLARVEKNSDFFKTFVRN